jgi:hypothetical protein
MSLVTGLLEALSMAFGMAWKILWALSNLRNLRKEVRTR